MLQVIKQETTLQIPKQFMADVMYILQSGVLNTRNDKAILHFDSKGLRVIEKSEKFIIPT